MGKDFRLRRAAHFRGEPSILPRDAARRAFQKSVGASTTLAAISQFFPIKTATAADAIVRCIGSSTASAFDGKYLGSQIHGGIVE